MSLPLLLLILFCLLLAAAAVQDATSLTISNWFSIAVLVTGIVSVVSQIEVGEWWQHVASFAITLAGGILLFSRGWFGGGDVKLLAAAALWFDLSGLASLLLITAVIGGLLAILAITKRMTIGGGLFSNGLATAKGGSIPYGVAIAVAGIALAFLGASAAGAPDAILNS